MDHARTPRRGPVGLKTLRQRIRDIEGTGDRLDDGKHGPAVTPLDVMEIDRHLPWAGLPLGALHEIIADDAGAATGFSAALIGKIARPSHGIEAHLNQDTRPVLWCESRHVMDAGGLYAPGLARFGLAPDRVILVRARRDQDVLWAMEEGLACAGLAAVIGETRTLSLTAGRRLQLAAATGGVTAFLLRPRSEAITASAAMTRWRVNTAPPDDADEPGLGRPRWSTELFRCRGGVPGTWILEWNDETGDFALVTPVRDGPAMPQPSRLAG